MKFLVIGLGSFGSYMAKTLYEKGNEVIAIDTEEKRIEEIKTFVSRAVIMDAANKENLQAMDIQDMDVVIVSSGPDMESSILTTFFLHEIGAKQIVAKALSEDHAKILRTIGATQVIFPEKDMAIRTALKLSSPNMLEFLPLISDVIIEEIAAPAKFIGKSLKELDLRNKYGIQIIAIRELIPEEAVFIPRADFVIKDSDVLIIMGQEKQLAKIDTL